jgi:hypothetical protein
LPLKYGLTFSRISGSSSRNRTINKFSKFSWI